MLVCPSKKINPLNLIIKTECLYLFGCTNFVFVAVCTLCIYHCLRPVSSLMAHVYLYNYESVQIALQRALCSIFERANIIKFELKHLGKRNRVVDVETVLHFLEFLDFNVAQTAQRQSLLFWWILTLRV